VKWKRCESALRDFARKKRKGNRRHEKKTAEHEDRERTSCSPPPGLKTSSTPSSSKSMPRKKVGAGSKKKSGSSRQTVSPQASDKKPDRVGRRSGSAAVVRLSRKEGSRARGESALVRELRPWGKRADDTDALSLEAKGCHQAPPEEKTLRNPYRHRPSKKRARRPTSPDSEEGLASKDCRHQDSPPPDVAGKSAKSSRKADARLRA